MAYTRTYSRRKWSEAIRELKAVLNSKTQPALLKVRCIEIMCLIHGLAPLETKRDRLTVRDLLSEHSMEKRLIKAVDAKLAAEDELRAQAEDAARTAQDKADLDDVFAGVLDDQAS